MQAFALDLETNARVSKDFYVPHERYSKRGSTHLADPRDVYEHISNFGMRRQRACMEAIIPKELLDEAVEACNGAVLAKATLTPERINKMLTAFANIGVSKQDIQQWLGYRLEGLTPRKFLRLNHIYQESKEPQNPADQPMDGTESEAYKTWVGEGKTDE